MTEGPIRDELAIRNLVARYADSITRSDHGDWASTWAPDGEWHVLGQTASGREACLKRLEELLSALAFVVQIPASGVIELDGDTGTGRWTLTEHGKFVGGDAFFSIGTYDDRYTRIDGRWHFRSRHFTTLYMGPPDLSAPVAKGAG
ncbi:MAG: nuclear transport factor 2 family protein [Myxococcota bacterium]|nr:nuclear transport factor 2 family protein [Myxococcota bacterium]